jgi:CheY-like chemotaxis protein
LVVDDNVDAADLLVDVLRGAGYAVVAAHDGPEALEVAATFRPEIAILDIGLPVMDGYELGERLKELYDVELLALTGYGQESDRQRSREAGFSRHLVKPTAPSELLAVVGDVLDTPAPTSSPQPSA